MGDDAAPDSSAACKTLAQEPGEIDGSVDADRGENCAVVVAEWKFVVLEDTVLQG
jgi:hypothetical protein